MSNAPLSKLPVLLFSEFKVYSAAADLDRVIECLLVLKVLERAAALRERAHLVACRKGELPGQRSFQV